VVLAEDGDGLVEGLELPLVVGQVAGCVQRSAVRAEEHHVLLDAERVEFQLPGVFLEDGLVEFLEALDQVVGGAVPHEPGLFDELVELRG